MNELAIMVDDYITVSGYKRMWIAEQVGISQQALYNMLHKKNFTVGDANRLLAPLKHKIEVQYNIVPTSQESDI